MNDILGHKLCCTTIRDDFVEYVVDLIGEIIVHFVIKTPRLPHKTVLGKHGKPDDVMIGMRGKKEPLPPSPVSGMYNKTGGKVRLTFKLESDQLWIGTKEHTEKVPMNSIKALVSEAIEGSEEYHIMGIQLGATEASRYLIYWVPAQYVDAIKDAVLGKWQF